MLYMTSLNYKNVNEIFYWNRGKMLRIPDGFTSLDYLSVYNLHILLRQQEEIENCFYYLKKKRWMIKKKKTFFIYSFYPTNTENHFYY